MSDLNSENWMPDKPNNHPSEYIENMVLYLQVIQLIFLSNKINIIIILKLKKF